MTATASLPPAEEALDQIMAIDEQVAYHEAQITALMARRSKLTSLNSSAARIIRVVCAVHGVPEAILMSKTRTKEVALARQMAMALIRIKLSWGVNRIGQLFNRDHGTASHAIHVMEDFIEVDPAVAALWEQTCARLDELNGKA